MAYTFTFPPDDESETITLLLPGDTPPPSQHEDPRAQRRRDLEARLEAGLKVLEKAIGCDGAEAERLLAHWDALTAEYGRLLARSEGAN